MSGLEAIHQAILDDPANGEATEAGILPLYTASEESRIAIIGQAPGKKAQDSGIPWHDQSGMTLRQWLGVDDDQFYDARLFALLPMDFYYPGKGAHGDLPPRDGFASTWHPRILAQLPDIELTVLIGRYALAGYLGNEPEGQPHRDGPLLPGVPAHLLPAGPPLPDQLPMAGQKPVVRHRGPPGAEREGGRGDERRLTEGAGPRPELRWTGGDGQAWAMRTRLPEGSRKAQSRTPQGWEAGSWRTSAPDARTFSNVASRSSVRKMAA